MKLVFKTRKQQRDLIKMDDFHSFALGGIPIWSSRQQVDEDMPKKF